MEITFSSVSAYDDSHHILTIKTEEGETIHEGQTITVQLVDVRRRNGIFEQSGCSPRLLEEDDGQTSYDKYAPGGCWGYQFG
jgi:hypothetical protein